MPVRAYFGIFWVHVVALVIALSCAVGPARASTIFFDDFSPAQEPGWSFVSPTAGVMGQLNNNVNVFGVTLTTGGAGANPGLLQFDLLGYRSIDHFNCCTDILTMRVNGSVMFTGAWSGDLLGVFGFSSNPSGASFSFLGYGVSGSDAAWRFDVPITLVLAGPNTFEWGYSALQGFTDEAWGLDNVRINDAVPEPATMLLMAGGLLGLAVHRLRRKRA